MVEADAAMLDLWKWVGLTLLNKQGYYIANFTFRVLFLMTVQSPYPINTRGLTKPTWFSTDYLSYLPRT